MAGNVGISENIVTFPYFVLFIKKVYGETKPVSIKQVKVIYGENQMKLVTEEITKIGARSDVLQNKVPAGNGSDPSPACGQSIFS